MNPFTRDPKLGPNHREVLAALVLLAATAAVAAVTVGVVVIIKVVAP